MNNNLKKVKFGFILLITTTCFYNPIKTDDVQDLPLHDVILNQNYTIQDKINSIKNILDSKVVDVNKQDDNGKTALNLIAFYKADPILARLLIEDYKANVNKPDRFNVSPLHNAIQHDEVEIAEMLLAADADRTLKNDTLATPVDLARSPSTMAIFGLPIE